MSKDVAIVIPGQDADSAPFEHPWQAQVFSLIVHLHQAGKFSWNTWVEVFSREIKAAPARADESINDAYYRQWVSAAEKLILSLAMTEEADIAQRATEWRQAYLHTPHGMPVILSNASCPPAHSHQHPTLRVPVAVSPAARTAELS